MSETALLRPRSSCMAAGVSVIMLLISGFLVLGGLYYISITVQFSQSAVPLTATVTAMEITQDEGPVYNIYARYVVNGQEYGERYYVSQQDYAFLQVGDPLAIEVLPHIPSESRLAGRIPWISMILPLLCGGVLMLLSLVFIVALISAFRAPAKTEPFADSSPLTG